jgi:hypothetical protein
MTVVGASGVIRLRLPPPPVDYDQRYEAVRNMSLENADRSNFKHFEDVDLANNERVIVVSNGGVRWYLTVTDAGTLGTAAV